MRHLIARYPDFYQGSPEFRDIQDALEPEALAIWAAEDGILAQLDVETATWGLRYWEQTLGIPVEEEKDIGFRRSRVRSKLRGSGVTTVAMLRDTAASFSNGEVEVQEFANQFRVELKFVGTIGVPPNMADLTKALREIIPAHLRWDYIIVYNTWGAVSSHIWAKLLARTWGAVKENDLNG